MPHHPTLADETQDSLDTAICTAIAELMAKVALQGPSGEVPPALYWTAQFDSLGRLTKIIGTVWTDVEEDAVPHILTAWVTALRFTPACVAEHGTLRYDGPVDGLMVSLWGIADYEEWKKPVPLATSAFSAQGATL